MSGGFSMAVTDRVQVDMFQQQIGFPIAGTDRQNRRYADVGAGRQRAQAIGFGGEEVNLRGGVKLAMA